MQDSSSDQHHPFWLPCKPLNGFSSSSEATEDASYERVPTATTTSSNINAHALRIPAPSALSHDQQQLPTGLPRRMNPHRRCRITQQSISSVGLSDAPPAAARAHSRSPSPQRRSGRPVTPYPQAPSCTSYATIATPATAISHCDRPPLANLSSIRDVCSSRRLSDHDVTAASKMAGLLVEKDGGNCQHHQPSYGRRSRVVSYIPTEDDDNAGGHTPNLGSLFFSLCSLFTCRKGRITLPIAASDTTFRDGTNASDHDAKQAAITAHETATICWKCGHEAQRR